MKRKPPFSINLSIFLHDQDQKVNISEQRDLTSRSRVWSVTFFKKNSPHFDQKGKTSQKRTARESTIKRSKVHLATSGNRVWPVTF